MVGNETISQNRVKDVLSTLTGKNVIKRQSREKKQPGVRSKGNTDHETEIQRGKMTD